MHLENALRLELLLALEPTFSLAGTPVVIASVKGDLDIVDPTLHTVDNGSRRSRDGNSQIFTNLSNLGADFLGALLGTFAKAFLRGSDSAVDDLLAALKNGLSSVLAALKELVTGLIAVLSEAAGPDLLETVGTSSSQIIELTSTA